MSFGRMLALALAAVAGVSASAEDVARLITEDGATTNCYASFSEALTAMPKKGGRLVVLKDLTVSAGQTLPVSSYGKRETIDLNGRRLTVTGDASSCFLTPAKAFQSTIEILNGTVDVQCGGFFDTPASWGRLELSGLTINCKVKRSAYLINARSDLTMTGCTVESAYMGCVWVGETFDGTGNAHAAAITNCTFVLKNGTQQDGVEYKTACVTATDRSTVTLKDCTCRAASGETTAYALYEGTSGGYLYVEGDAGLYDGALKSTKTFENGGGVYLRGGTFRNCAFMTPNVSQTDKFYYLSGGVYDTDPATNGNRYVDIGYEVQKLSDTPPQWRVAAKDQQPEEVVVKTSKGVDITSVVQLSVSGGVVTVGDLIDRDDAGAYTTVEVTTAKGTETIRVNPEFAQVTVEEETVGPVTETAVGIRTIPGLTYQLLASETLFGTMTEASEPVMAEGTTMKLEVDPAKFVSSTGSAFFRVVVSR